MGREQKMWPKEMHSNPGFCTQLCNFRFFSSEKLSLIEQSSLSPPQPPFSFYIILIHCVTLFYLLFPSLECKLLREWALPILIMVLHCLAHGWCSVFTERMNEASHSSIRRLSFFFLPRMDTITLSHESYKASIRQYLHSTF